MSKPELAAWFAICALGSSYLGMKSAPKPEPHEDAIITTNQITTGQKVCKAMGSKLDYMQGLNIYCETGERFIYFRRTDNG